MKVPMALLASLLAFTGYVATSSKAARTDATIPSKFPMLTAFPTNSVYAGHNCKCQIGGNGSPQDDNASALCCLIQQDNGGFINQVGGITFHPDQHHQCSSSINSIDSGAFVQCCKDQGVGGIGAYCWD